MMLGETSTTSANKSNEISYRESETISNVRRQRDNKSEGMSEHYLDYCTKEGGQGYMSMVEPDGPITD